MSWAVTAAKSLTSDLLQSSVKSFNDLYKKHIAQALLLR